MPEIANGRAPEPVAVGVPVGDLFFDKRNPRLVDALQEAGKSPSQDAILEVLWREFAVDEIALSVAANGYFPQEPLFAEQQDDGKLVVVEGNRRLAAVKLLLDAGLRRKVKATDLPKIGKRRHVEISTLPVVKCDRASVWQYIGFKHVNGPQSWQSLAKAEYIAWVHNTLGVDLDEVANRIGDQHATVRRLYRSLMALEQVEAGGAFDRRDRWKKHFSFSHLYTGLDYRNIQRFAGISGDGAFKRRPVHRSKVKQFGELCVWLYGSKSKERPPVVQSQNPDLRNLDEVLSTQNGLAALRRNLPLQVSLDISKGDDRMFREFMVVAKQALQEALGRVLTGYEGDLDLLESAADVRALAGKIHEEMREVYEAKRSRRRQKTATGR
jgi:hypothetical protein